MIEKVKAIIAEYVGYKAEDITLDMHLVDDLCINSYDIMSIIARFEEEFNITVPDREVRHFHKVQDIVDFIKKSE
ncbi:MAG: acyl carrier protein [Erysipelotrichaceae bacterium]